MIEPVRDIFDGEPIPQYPQARTRTIHLWFTVHGDDKVSLRAFGGAFPDDGGGGFQGRLQYPATEIRAAITSLRDTWQRQVIERREQSENLGRAFPYVDHWDLTGATHPTRWDDVCLRLAREGKTLYTLLFEAGDQGLREIGWRLSEALNDEEQIITIHSEDLHVPWSMLYTPQPGVPSLEAPDAKWVASGFWGYNHLVEQCLGRVYGHDSRIHLADGRLKTGMNVDPRLDTEFQEHPCVEPMIEFFRGHTDVAVRQTRPQLAASLTPGCAIEQIVYFACHMKVSGTSTASPTQAHLTLSDDDPIRTTDVQGWLANNEFRPGPIVFANGCQGGQLASQFYGSIGAALLHAGVNCLIGPQVDMPPLFAFQYAYRFFEQLFQRGVRVGDIIRDLARFFADDCENPLGIAISLYRGLDTHINPDESTPQLV
jgi:hypothetical protein